MQTATLIPTPAAAASKPDLRSVMLMAHVYARMSSTGTYAERFAAGLRQSWAEEKAEVARKAARSARLAARAAVNVQLDLLEQERLLAMAGRTVPYSRGFREVRTGRVQGGRW